MRIPTQRAKASKHKTMRRGVRLGLVLALALVSSQCGTKAGDTLKQLLCGRGDAKSKMTVGFDLDILSGLLGLRAESVSDESIQTFLNGMLEKAKISSEQFNVKKVESIIPGDTVRFLEVGGNFGEAFGLGAEMLKSAFSASSLTASNPLTFISESYNVSAAAAQQIHFRAKVHRLAEEALPDDLESYLRAEASGHADQWAYDQTEFAKAQALFVEMLKVNGRDINGDEPVKVAVLDTGVAKAHADLKDHLLDGFNATGEGADSAWNDENGHGTHCAGIIGARKNSDESPLGVATMANVKIVPVKVLGENGSGGFQAIEKGIRHAMKQGADVISMSLGAGIEFSEVEGQGGLANQVMNEAIAKGIIIVIAAGNESCPLGGSCGNDSLFGSSSFREYTVLPCAYSGSICVGASNADETLAEYSNYSSKKEAQYRTHADVNAPGTAIYSTWFDGGYKTISGTSMATPYVAGIAALLKAVDPTLKQAKVIELLKAAEVYPKAMEDKSDTGRLDLYAVLNHTARSHLKMSDVAEYAPKENPVEAPEVEEGGLDAVGDLWGSICQ